MKFLENRFEEYLQASDQLNLHPSFSAGAFAGTGELRTVPHCLFYGPPGVGKYTQALRLIRRFSPSALKYEKKMQVVHDKRTYQFRISDVHVEVDMSLLGCNACSLWHEFYQQLQDVVSAKPEKAIIVVCKHFHDVHLELLDSFYSYFAGNRIKFFLLSNHLSFLPDSLLQSCTQFRFPRPAATIYAEVLRSKGVVPAAAPPTNILTNIKLATLAQYPAILETHRVLCDKLLHAMQHLAELDVLRFRDFLHDVFIYQLSLPDCTWYILSKLLQNGLLPTVAVQTRAVLLTLRFLRMINANFRPIFHLEYYLLQLALLIRVDFAVDATGKPS